MVRRTTDLNHRYSQARTMSNEQDDDFISEVVFSKVSLNSVETSMY